MEYCYGDENWSPKYGEEAKKLIQVRNDAKYLDENFGVISVPKDRWAEAQKAEKNGWMKLWVDCSDDRNYDHYQMFEQYKVLNQNVFNHAIELGCGPFTNLRLIGATCKIYQCVLLDPLIEDYLDHPHCAYNRNQLICVDGTVIPIADILKVPIEEYCALKQYDLVIVINVIQHCYDIRSVFSSINNMLKTDGVLIFHDAYYDHERVTEAVNYQYDQGHPLKTDRKLINQFLKENFKPLYQHFEAGLVYYIGQK